MISEAAWPEGVFARYFTVGGATVDLTVIYTLPPDPQPIATLASCTGCPSGHQEDHYRVRYSFYHSGSTEEHDPQTAEEKARGWAQSHAETCRAMPRPGGAR